MTASGLRFDELVDNDLRRAVGLRLGKTFEEVDACLDRLASLRSGTRVVVNPSWLSAASLSPQLNADQATHAADEHIAVDYGLPKFPIRYVPDWKLVVEDREAHEGQPWSWSWWHSMPMTQHLHGCIGV